MKKSAGIVVLVLAGCLVGLGAWGWSVLHTPYKGYEGERVVDIPPGYGTRAIVDVLIDAGVLRYRYPSLVWLYLSPNRGALQAGEYLFSDPLDVPGVFATLSSGRVRLYTLTIPEGFRIDQIAERWEQQGFGDSGEFLAAVGDALPEVRRIDPDAVSVEGYLFPETYSFPRGVTADEAVTAMIRGFDDAVRRLEAELPRSEWALDLNGTIRLASLVESEVAVSDERELVASVFMNRLDRNMRLECDPTVVYALLQDGSYRGRLLTVDLAFDSPYNTYRYPDLPPGAISNPGYFSLRAAAVPAETDYLFFVRTTGGRHTFSRTLVEHNRAVAAYRRMNE